MSDSEAVSVREQETRRARRWVAVLVALFVPGGGYMARGLVRRGALWLGAITVVFAVMPWVPQVGFVAIGLWLVAAFDAWRAPDGPWLPRVDVALGLVLGYLGAVLVLRFVLMAFYVEAYKIPSGAMIPTLEIGDHIFVNKLSGGAEPGDVVVFVSPCEPAKDFVMRVVAVGGDRVEVRCGVVYVNGAAVARELVEGPDTCRYWDYDEGMDEWREQSCTRYRETLANGESFDVLGTERTDEPDGHDFPRGGPNDEVPMLPRCLPGMHGRSPGAPIGRFEDSGDGGAGDACAQHLAYVVPEEHFFVMGDNRQNSSDSRAWGPVPNDMLEGQVVSIWWASQPERAGGIKWGRIGRLP